MVWNSTQGLCRNFTELQGVYKRSLHQVSWLSSTATFRPPLNDGSMALGSTTCRQRHGVGKGGEWGPERGGEQTEEAGETGNGQGTKTGESGV